MGGLHPKRHAGTADHPGGCPGQNILEIKNSGRSPHLVGQSEEEEELQTRLSKYVFSAGKFTEGRKFT